MKISPTRSRFFVTFLMSLTAILARPESVRRAYHHILDIKYVLFKSLQSK